MDRNPSHLLLIIAVGWLTAAAAAAQTNPVRIVTIGDSITEEYGFEIPFSAPASNPTNANTYNWVEILNLWRGAVSPGSGDDYCDFGTYQKTWPSYADLRGAGFSYNFGVPTFTTTQWIDVIATTDPFSNLTYYLTRDALLERCAYSSVIVILLGANDLSDSFNAMYYGTLDPSWDLGLVANIKLICLALRYNLRFARPVLPIVVCTIPDLGVTPKEFADHNDPILRSAMRTRVQALNDHLRSEILALGDTEIADIHAFTLRIEDEVPVKINGTPFTIEGDPENPPDRIFCRDDFHPSTVSQAIIANQIIDATNRLIGTGIPQIESRELLGSILGLNPDKPFNDWIATQGVAATGMHDNPDGDPFDNLAEFSLGLSAGTPDPGLGHDWSGPGGDRFGILWSPNPAAEGYLEIVPMHSPDLANWSPLDPGDIEDLGNGNWRASIDSGDPAAFLKTDVNFAP